MVRRKGCGRIGREEGGVIRVKKEAYFGIVSPLPPDFSSRSCWVERWLEELLSFLICFVVLSEKHNERINVMVQHRGG